MPYIPPAFAALPGIPGSASCLVPIMGTENLFFETSSGLMIKRVSTILQAYAEGGLAVFCTTSGTTALAFAAAGRSLDLLKANLLNLQVMASEGYSKPDPIINNKATALPAGWFFGAVLTTAHDVYFAHRTGTAFDKTIADPSYDTTYFSNAPSADSYAPTNIGGASRISEGFIVGSFVVDKTRKQFCEGVKAEFIASIGGSYVAEHTQACDEFIAMQGARSDRRIRLAVSLMFNANATMQWRQYLLPMRGAGPFSMVRRPNGKYSIVPLYDRSTSAESRNYNYAFHSFDAIINGTIRGPSTGSTLVIAEAMSRLPYSAIQGVPVDKFLQSVVPGYLYDGLRNFSPNVASDVVTARTISKNDLIMVGEYTLPAEPRLGFGGVTAANFDSSQNTYAAAQLSNSKTIPYYVPVHAKHVPDCANILLHDMVEYVQNRVESLVTG